VLRALGAFLFAIAMGIGASVQIPLPWTPVPITLQTFVLFLGASLLGRHYAIQMIAWYLALGGMGWPLFAGGASGWAAILGPTGGYLIGFVASAAWIGYMQSRVTGLGTQIGLYVGSSIILFAFGTTWLAYALGLSVSQALWAGVMPFIPGDLLKNVIAATIVQSGWQYCSKNQQ
jgi:biotin transport system substrate-specific component